MLMALAVHRETVFGTLGIPVEPATEQAETMRAELMGMRRLCSPSAHVLGWYVHPSSEEIWLILERRGGESVSRRRAAWADVVMVVRRAEVPQLLLAQATSPIVHPERGADRAAWSRWLADPRVELKVLDPSDQVAGPVPAPTGRMFGLAGELLPQSMGARTRVPPFIDR
ncbi:MAG: hypothetical protein MK085_02530 [Phycisphaerales bacterium]|nr:hypothetical protein [Phycisphaerales bacterium]